MRITSPFALAISLLFVTACNAFAQAHLQSTATVGSNLAIVAVADTSGIDVEHAWARATVGSVSNSAAYLTMTDNGRPDRLTGVSTPVAASAGLHQSVDENGVMKMRPVTAIALVPGKPVALAPGGYHVMLMGLKHPLKAGDSFPLTLIFEHAPPMTISVKVEPMGASGMQGQMGHMP